MHELIAAFADAALPLRATLVEMLEDHCHHRTQRRGCGYTQATRFLSSFVNLPRSRDCARDAALFERAPIEELDALATSLLQSGWEPGWRRLDEAPAGIAQSAVARPVGRYALTLSSRLRHARSLLQLHESVMLFDMIEQLIVDRCPAAPELPGMPDKPEIGSCTMAEEFFLEIAHGRIRRGGEVNVYVDDDGRPLLVEKVNLGESHSAIAVDALTLNGVWIPPGALFALRMHPDADPGDALRWGRRRRLAAIRQARFLRLTTLSVAPEIRERAFAHQLQAQLESGMFSPETTTIDSLREFAAADLAPA